MNTHDVKISRLSFANEDVTPSFFLFIQINIFKLWKVRFFHKSHKLIRK